MRGQREKSGACEEGSLTLWFTGPVGPVFMGCPGTAQTALSICEEVEASGHCLRAAPGGFDKWECTKDFSVNQFFKHILCARY